MPTLAIREVVRATSRAIILRLDLAGRAFPYHAGQAVLVGRPGGTLRRAYSIAVAPHEAARDGALELLVGLEEDGTPGPHLERLEPGTPVAVEGPMGAFRFTDEPSQPRLLFVAGGTGIAPLRAMLHEALARPDGRGIGVLYSARSPDEFAYESELRALADAGRLELRLTVTRSPGPTWTGARGRIALGHLSGLVHGPDTLCFVCGPHALVQDVPQLLRRAGVPDDRIRVEDWGS